MKSKLAAAALATLAAALPPASALADGPRPSSYNTIAKSAEQQVMEAQSATAHFEWQYHYVGHHPRYEGHWVLVR